MPTGYTADIEKGITFQQFAMGCARAFGACVEMRDDPQAKAIPDEFKPSDYHVRALREANTELENLEKLTIEEVREHALLEYEKEFERITKEIDKDRKLMGQYKAMLKQVKAWQPPTSEHVGLKEFMVSQIEGSIDFDGMGDYYRKHPAILLSGSEWLVGEKAKARRDISYHTEEHQKEIDRTNGRNQWTKDLRESLI